LFADSCHASCVDRLRAGGHVVTLTPDLDEASLAEAITGHDAVVVRSTRVTATALEAGERLGLVVRAGAGVNTIDLDTASARGIAVCNTPGRNAVAVAELTMGLLLSIDRHIAEATADARAGRWDKGRYSQASGLAGRRLGIVGLGGIGTEVATRAAAFGLELHTLDRAERSAAARRLIDDLDVTVHSALAELARAVDILTLHVPGGDATRHFVDAAVLAALAADSDAPVLLNTSRGDVVDPEALLGALDVGLHAGLDVWPDEPGGKQGEWASTLARHSNVVATHHIGASTDQAQASVADAVAEVIEAFDEGRLLNCVNVETRPLGSCTVVVRHLDRVGVLAGVFDVLRRADINVEQMENRVFTGGRAAMALIEVVGEVGGDLVGELSAGEHILSVSVRGADC
jgi:D-3-phosphoglycerate dehydrogenase